MTSDTNFNQKCWAQHRITTVSLRFFHQQQLEKQNKTRARKNLSCTLTRSTTLRRKNRSAYWPAPQPQQRSWSPTKWPLLLLLLLKEEDGHPPTAKKRARVSLPLKPNYPPSIFSEARARDLSLTGTAVSATSKIFRQRCCQQESERNFCDGRKFQNILQLPRGLQEVVLSTRSTRTFGRSEQFSCCCLYKQIFGG